MRRTWRKNSRRRVRRIDVGGKGGESGAEGGDRRGEKRRRRRGCEEGRLLEIVRRR